MVSTIFTLWDYEAQTVTRFRREGRCNNCGICCRRRITFSVVNPVEKENLRQGGTFTSGQGQWVETQVNGQRVFFRMRTTEESDTCCRYLGDDNRCQIYERRWLLCRTWPHSPFDVVAIPECTFHFQILGHWRFSELKLAPKKSIHSI